jgi:hypothetical protein
VSDRRIALSWFVIVKCVGTNISANGDSLVHFEVFSSRSVSRLRQQAAGPSEGRHPWYFLNESSSPRRVTVTARLGTYIGRSSWPKVRRRASAVRRARGMPETRFRRWPRSIRAPARVAAADLEILRSIPAKAENDQGQDTT